MAFFTWNTAENLQKTVNVRAKAAGWYTTVDVLDKNFFAEAYYHHAIVAEFDKMLAAVQSLLKRHYTAIRMQNAEFQGSNDPRVNAENSAKKLSFTTCRKSLTCAEFRYNIGSVIRA